MWAEINSHGKGETITFEAKVEGQEELQAGQAHVFLAFQEIGRQAADGRS